MIEMSYSGSTLSVEGTEVDLPANVVDAKIIDETVVVLLDWSDTTMNNQNIWAIDKDGKKLWDIEVGDKKDGKHRPYTGIRTSKSELWCYNWNGLEYRIDIRNGEIVDKQLAK